MKLHIADFAVAVDAFNEKKGTLMVRVEGKHRSFFDSWIKKVFQAKPWENFRKMDSCVRYGYLIPDGEPFTSPKKREVRVYPKFLEPKTGTITFELTHKK